ncbi:hypothetical protein [Streptomyces sp. 8L]|uniref:hypothetical protein n=1 Tax=Streptomyces sp. 8L TaxID=2877242 RepID=UPI001CD7DB71|nr:hypothetical protein [Streptomyces sp. 8L]MCA1218129.1 hypothetical protein [Streptomyces sp. 8L]
MWKVPVTAPEALPYVVAAAKRDGYLGLMVVLARTAEARTLHQELSRDWTSIHDVTGHRIAVLCPDPGFVSEEEPGGGEYYALRNHVSDFWQQEMTLADCLELDHTRVLIPGTGRTSGVPVASAPYPEEVRQAAWTEAVTRCAGFFGIEESRLPAVLVLCLREERDVLVQLRQDTSMYSLCKRIASHPGYAPGDDHRLRERVHLRGEVEDLAIGHGSWGYVTPDNPPRTMDALLSVDKVARQVGGLRQHLRMVDHADPGLCRAWADGLTELVRTNAAEDVARAYLATMEAAAAAHPRRTDLRRLDTKVRKVSGAIEAAAHPRPEYRHLPESEERRREREERLARARSELAEVERRLASMPGLAGACEAAARAELSPCEVERPPLSDGPSGFTSYRGYDRKRVITVRPVGAQPASPRPAGASRNDLSGTVHGLAVQAGHVDTVHFHAQGAPRTTAAWRDRLRRAKKDRRDRTEE